MWTSSFVATEPRCDGVLDAVARADCVLPFARPLAWSSFLMQRKGHDDEMHKTPRNVDSNKVKIVHLLQSVSRVLAVNNIAGLEERVHAV